MAFNFHAKATAFGASFTQPANEVIPSQASVSLAATGGQGFDRVEKFNWRNVVTFDEATAYVSGIIAKGRAETYATTQITNLNILNVVRARTITASVTSVNTLGSGQESEVSFIASFEDLKVGATTVEASFDTGLYDSCQTYDRFKSHCMSNLDSFAQRYGWHDTAAALRQQAIDERERLLELGQEVPEPIQIACDTQTLDKVPEIHGSIRASLVSQCTFKGPALTPKWGYGFEIAGFGTIYLAEVVMKQGHRRLNMLRLDLGSPTIGNGSSNDVEGNGAEIPP